MSALGSGGKGYDHREDALRYGVSAEYQFKPLVGTPDSEIVPAEEGCTGMQSPTYYRFDLMDPKAMFQLGKVLNEGCEKYGPDNWREIPVRNHLNKALIHIYSFLSGDTQDEHLSHAFCRLMMALANDSEGLENT